ncbi:DUF6843 domain-containing protein [Paenisporosarcina quisquiliarum]|uniref:DUF6843 domain-containing protein n=1 Tax=Paenisporosarcina quisquiliarum TaxID=365346 RepID=UPI003735A7B3
MTKNICILISIVLSLILIWWLIKPNNDTTIVYHLPKGFKGCIDIYFNEPNKKELEIIDDTLLLIVPENGSISTSSSYDLIMDLGWYKIKAFYIDNDGKRVSEINTNDFYNVSSTTNGNSERMMITFDSNQEHCY